MVQTAGGFKVFARTALGGTLLALFSCISCQDGYPIPASQCDQWCDATKAFGCVAYDPAGCVATCHRGGGDVAECRSQLDTLLSCVSVHPVGNLSCDDWYESVTTAVAPRPCFIEEQDFEGCTAPHAECGTTSLFFCPAR